MPIDGINNKLDVTFFGYFVALLKYPRRTFERLTHHRFIVNQNVKSYIKLQNNEILHPLLKRLFMNLILGASPVPGWEATHPVQNKLKVRESNNLLPV